VGREGRGSTTVDMGLGALVDANWNKGKFERRTGHNHEPKYFT
jgi:hypothetical protein